MKKEYLLLFLTLSILSLSNLSNLCGAINQLSFDNQILLTWRFSEAIGQMPYRDVFFPYGLETYYKFGNILFSVIYYFLTPFLLTYIFFVFQKNFRNRLYSYLSLLLLFIFIIKFTGFEIFSRYGILVLFACAYAKLFYSYKNDLKNKYICILGIGTGLVFPLYNDQGIYAFILFFLFLFTDRLYRKYLKLQNLIKETILYIFGFIIGMIPFLIFLVWNNSLIQFVKSVFDLSDLSQYAKVPFFHSIVTVDNVFTLLMLFLAIIFIGYKIIYSSAKLTLNLYVVIGLVYSLIIVEQKNIMRSIDVELSFIGLLIFIFLFFELKKYLNRNGVSNLKSVIYYVNIAIILLFIIGFKIFYSNVNQNSCKGSRNIFAINNTNYKNIKNYLSKNFKAGNEIFSYPADPVLYIVLHQAPPYYPGIFDGSSRNAQLNMINYIKIHKIQLIIYNYNNYAVEDEVPNYIRGIAINQYVLNNYDIKQIIGSYLIMQRNNSTDDFFNNKLLSKIPKFRNSLLQTNMENIPRSEGIYKLNEINKAQSKLVTKAEASTIINKYLKNNFIYSNNIFLVINFNKRDNNKQQAVLSIKTNDDYGASIRFNTCEKEVSCVIHLSNSPLFYRNRLLKDISFDKNSLIGSVKIYRITGDTDLW